MDLGAEVGQGGGVFEEEVEGVGHGGRGGVAACAEEDACFLDEFLEREAAGLAGGAVDE